MRFVVYFPFTPLESAAQIWGAIKRDGFELLKMIKLPDIIKSRRIKDAVLDTLWYSAKLNEKVSLINYWSVDEKIFTFSMSNFFTDWLWTLVSVIKAQ